VQVFKKAVSLLFVITLITSVFAACSKNDGSNAGLVFPIEIEPRSLDPQIADTNADIITANCFEGLVRNRRKRNDSARRCRKLGYRPRRTGLYIPAQAGFKLAFDR
jgi:hypothetical protein